MRSGLPILDEALELLARAEAGGVGLRLLGGLAVKASCPSAQAGPLARTCGDMDFAASGPGPKIEAFFAAASWKAKAEFNLYNGSDRLIFSSPQGNKADVFVGRFSMCHALAFKDRLGVDPLRLPLAELLLTKLQVVEANAKDLSDAAAILLDHALGEGDGEDISRLRLAKILGDDWGFWNTARMSLAKIRVWAPNSGLDARALAILEARLGEMSSLFESCPKTGRWKLRSLVGEKLQWYENPEEAEA